MQLIGLARLGRDAELRTTPSGEKVTNLSLAYNHGRKGDDGKRPTQWVDAALWGKRADALIDYLTKGRALCVTVDDVHVEEYADRDGHPRSKLVGNISSIELAGGGEQREGGAPAPAPRTAAPAPRAPAAAPRPAAKPAGGFDDMDDDIPF